MQLLCNPLQYKFSRGALLRPKQASNADMTSLQLMPLEACVVLQAPHRTLWVVGMR